MQHDPMTQNSGAVTKVSGAFAKGYDPRRNAGGRPKALVDVEAAARQRTTLAIATLAAIADDADQPAAARVSPSVALLDRAWGKPRQHIEGAQMQAVQVIIKK